MLDELDAPCSREAGVCPTLPVQYADFAVWQREWLSGGCWSEQLDVLAVGARRSAGAGAAHRSAASAVRSTEGRVLEFTVPGTGRRGLRAVARRAGATMFMTLLGAFAALLSRHCGQDDVVVGTPIANRNRAETEGLVGFFVNTLALRTDLSGDPTFAELLNRVRGPGPRGVRPPGSAVRAARGRARRRAGPPRTPLFQVFFNYLRHRDDVPTRDESGTTGGHREIRSRPQTRRGRGRARRDDRVQHRAVRRDPRRPAARPFPGAAGGGRG